MKMIFNREHSRCAFFPFQTGATILESLGFLGIAAIVILGAVSLVSRGFKDEKENQVAQEIVQIRTAVKKMYIMNQKFPSAPVMNQSLVESGFTFPGSLTMDPSTYVVTNAFGGTVEVRGSTKPRFDIDYTGVPKEYCINLIATSTGWDKIVVNTRQIPPTVDEAAHWCNQDINTIEWVGLLNN